MKELQATASDGHVRASTTDFTMERLDVRDLDAISARGHLQLNRLIFERHVEATHLALQLPDLRTRSDLVVGVSVDDAHGLAEISLGDHPLCSAEAEAVAHFFQLHHSFFNAIHEWIPSLGSALEPKYHTAFSKSCQHHYFSGKIEV